MLSRGSINPNNYRVNVTLSVGQSKIGAGAIDQVGYVIYRLPEIKTPPETTALYAAIVQQIRAVVDAVRLPNVRQVGVSFPELVPPPRRLMADPEQLGNAPNPIRDAIAILLAQEIGSSLIVEVLHDAAAAVLGEVSNKGTLPGCRDCVFIVWGTGVASGIISEGQLYWRDPLIGQMTGEIGLQVIRTFDGRFEYRPSPTVPDLNVGEQRLDRWLRGPEIARRFRQQIKQDHRGHRLLALAGKPEATLDLVDVNRAARQGDALALALIEDVGREMGRALAPFIQYWRVVRKIAFVEKIIIGSGVTKLGDGLKRGGKGVFITAIREGLGQALIAQGIDDYDTTQVRISAIGYEREFYAFILA